jgi:tellurite resistance protein TehA-like permease
MPEQWSRISWPTPGGQEAVVEQQARRRLQLRFARGRPDRLETLDPGYFALVMATGIVALAARLHGVPLLPTLLFWLNAGFSVALAVATVLRILRYPRAFAADLQSHSRGVGFFTIIAAGGVFGSQLVIQQGAVGLAFWLWVATALLWVVITYGVLALLTVNPDKPSLAAGLNGGWLVSVVATQSLAILTVTLVGAGAAAGLREPLMFLALILWLGGGALYLWLMTLIFFRYTFLPMTPEDLTPPYWINMGAVAISTLSGAGLLEHPALSPTIAALVPFVEGFTLFFWAIGSWWIPMLVVLGFWRYLLRGVAFSYDPLYWGGVFPLGMYSVATAHLAGDLDIAFLLPLSRGFMAIAVIAWAAAFAGLIETLLGGRRAGDAPPRRNTTAAARRLD